LGLLVCVVSLNGLDVSFELAWHVAVRERKVGMKRSDHVS
jgi:hypothetical protein